MRGTTVSKAASAALLLLAGCAGPTATSPGAGAPAADVASPAPEATAAAATEAAPPEDEGPPVVVEELPPAPAAAGPAIEEGTAARLVPVGGLRAYAGGIASKIRRAMGPPPRDRRDSLRSGGAIADGAIGSMEMGSGPPSPPSRATPTATAARPPEPSAAAPGAPAAEGESITNVQVAGVDEGGIVKAWGEYLVVLRRGRLFTIRLGEAEGAARPVAALDVRPSGDDHDAWYDEMLVHAPSGTVVVIGFSYDHGATEIGLFRIGAEGTLSRLGTHLLRSNDYYSSRNYASRLVGDTLVFYMPHFLAEVGDYTARVSLPATKPLRGGSWRSIVTDSEVYRVSGIDGAATLHTVVTCDLAAPRFACRARGIVGGEGRTFFVSQSAIYVWVMPSAPVWTEWASYSYEEGDEDQEEEEQVDPSQLPAHLFRLPLDGSRPSALVVRGAPIDQFSFNETAEDLWVLVQAEGGGDAMWAPELSSGALGLLRVPLSAFGRDVRAMGRAAYSDLPSPAEGAGRYGTLQDRFVGDYLLYGAGVSWGSRPPGAAASDRVFLHRYGEGRTFVAALPSGADRIEAMAEDAVVIGTDGENLHFRAFELGPAPVAAGTYVQQGAAQGETRSHGFFYRPTGEREGLLGLPVVGPGRPGVAQLREGSAAVLYLSVASLRFSPLGELRAGTAELDDRCEVSCTDWYGNARPLFYRGRVFALLGYELVEGRIAGGAISEVARTSMLSALPPALAAQD